MSVNTMSLTFFRESGTERRAILTHTDPDEARPRTRRWYRSQ
jgi:hypothetical protein